MKNIFNINNSVGILFKNVHIIKNIQPLKNFATAWKMFFKLSIKYVEVPFKSFPLRGKSIKIFPWHGKIFSKFSMMWKYHIPFENVL